MKLGVCSLVVGGSVLALLGAWGNLRMGGVRLGLLRRVWRAQRRPSRERWRITASCR
jgi:hypothetical protein